MANSRYEYVREFEREEILLPNTWIVVRIDGRGFHKLSTIYKFRKPNDVRALHLMNRAAQSVFRSVPDLCIAYGVSDEYSFVFHPSTTLFERRASKLVSTIVSAFTSAYMFHWSEYFGRGGLVSPSSPSASNARPEDGEDTKIEEELDVGDRGAVDANIGDDDGCELQAEWLPTFDGRAVCYPSLANLRDYLSWRQVDCHINNLYNTTFWTLVQQGHHTVQDAERLLKGTLAADKNEILFSRFGINYNHEPDMFRKGSLVFREYKLVDHDHHVDHTDHTAGHDATTPSNKQKEKQNKARKRARVVVTHDDLIRDAFWSKRPWILTGKPGENI